MLIAGLLAGAIYGVAPPIQAGDDVACGARSLDVQARYDVGRAAILATSGVDREGFAAALEAAIASCDDSVTSNRDRMDLAWRYALGSATLQYTTQRLQAEGLPDHAIRDLWATLTPQQRAAMLRMGETSVAESEIGQGLLEAVVAAGVPDTTESRTLAVLALGSFAIMETAAAAWR